MSVGSQVATIVGGFAPLFATALQPKFGTWPISALLLSTQILGLIALLYMRNASSRSRTRVTSQHAVRISRTTA